MLFSVIEQEENTLKDELAINGITTINNNYFLSH